MEQDYRRGEIYFTDLNPVFGHEQGGFRPVLIVQNDAGNYYSPNVIVATVTSQIQKQRLPTHVLLDVDGLPEPSLFQLENLRTLDKRRLRGHAGTLTDEQMEQIDAALRVSLYLSDDDYLPMEVDAP